MNIRGLEGKPYKYGFCEKQAWHGGSLGQIGKILLFLSILLEKNEFLARLDFLQWFVLAALASVLFIQLCFKNEVLSDFAFLRMLVFAVFVAASLGWAMSGERVFKDIKYMVKTIVVISYALHVIKKDGNPGFLISSMILSTVASAAMILPNIMSPASAYGRNVVVIMGILVNTNQVCPDLAFATVLLAYDLKNRKRKLCKAMDAGLIIVFGTIICILGARASLIVMAAGILLSVFEGSRRKMPRKLLLAALLGMAALAAVLYIPSLYAAIGVRIKDFISLAMGNDYASENQRSDHFRMQLIQNGWAMFVEKPLLGYGSGNYMNVGTRNYGIRFYAHNNYIELAVGLGMAGVLLYYSLHAKLLFRILRTKAADRSSQMQLAGQILLCMLLFDMTCVTYNVMNMWLLLLIAYAGASPGHVTVQIGEILPEHCGAERKSNRPARLGCCGQKAGQEQNENTICIGTVKYWRAAKEPSGNA